MKSTRKRTWHAGKPKKKPDYDSNAITEELLEAVTRAYEGEEQPSLQSIANSLLAQGFTAVNPIKVRKLLITAGEAADRPIYQSSAADKVLALWKEGKSADEIMSYTGLSRSSVNSYLPYTKIIYKMRESSVGADREKLYRDRKKACEALRKELENPVAELTCEKLWKAIAAFQDYPFRTGEGLKFTYKVKDREILITGKEESITRETVNTAFQRALELDRAVSESQEPGAPGASYLYPVFVRLGVIKKELSA